VVLCRLLGGDDEQRSADEEEADVDVCGLGSEDRGASRIDDMLNAMETFHDGGDDPARNIDVSTCL